MDLQSNFYFISWEIRGFKNKPVTVFQTTFVKPFLITLSTNLIKLLTHIYYSPVYTQLCYNVLVKLERLNANTERCSVVEITTSNSQRLPNVDTTTLNSQQCTKVASTLNSRLVSQYNMDVVKAKLIKSWNYKVKFTTFSQCYYFDTG